MRVISGKLARRTFNPPLEKWNTRPTTDKAKEGLFNILKDHIDFEGIRFLDLFCGSGAQTYEVISRGAVSATCIDSNPDCHRFIESVLEKFEIRDKVKLIRSDVFKYLERSRASFDLIFADPPYKDRRIPHLPNLVLGSDNLLAEGGMFVLEHNEFHNFEYHERNIGMRAYGKSHFSFFR